MRCQKCQQENPIGKKFCHECGTRLALACPQCGSELIPSDKFCSNCGQKLLGIVEPGLETSEPVIEAGRKQATVLFSDLLGYTAMSRKLDPEDVKDVMSQIFREIAQVVAKYEGLIDKFIGDGVLAIFGIPKAHEDDAIRAIRAAREIHDRVLAISPSFRAKVGHPLIMHSGIDTGLIVTSELGIGNVEYTTTGDTINMASRLSDLAKEDEILVGPDTYRRAEGYFDFQDLGPTDIEGRAEPLQIYKLLSVRDSPVTIHRLSGLKAELIGRKVEMARLGEAMGKLQNGVGSIVSIIGDAGTGKSRLVEEFKATLDLNKVQWLEGHAYAYCQNIPYYPFIDMMNRIYGINEGDSPENIREKLGSTLEEFAGKGNNLVPYIGSLYSLSYPELEGINPEFWRNALYKAALEILSATAQREPTVVFIEDIHWADPSTLELLRYISVHLKYPALILYTYRPYISLFATHEITGFSNTYEEIHIHDLSPSEAQSMMGSLLMTEDIPYELRRFIQQKAEGNPFYLEEVVNSLIESEVLVRSNGSWKLTMLLKEYNLSSTIQGIISARVDGLDKDMKRTLQEASVIGRAFLYTIIMAVTESQDQADQRLNELERLDWIRIRSTLPDVEYIFKHALTHEVVYSGLLQKDREKIHERIGFVIERLFPDRLPEFYESLAFHFKQGTSVSKAVYYLVKSGEKCFSKDSMEEAHQYFKEAFDLLSNKPNKSKEEEGLLIDILTDWSSITHARGDWQGLTVILMDHKDTVESFGDKSRLGMFYAWLGFALYCHGRLRDSREYLQKALSLGEEVQNQRVIAYAHNFLAWVCADLGLIEEGILHGEKATELISRISLTMIDVFLFSQAVGGTGWAYWHRGDKRKVMEAAETLLKVGQKDYHTQNLAMGQWMKAFGYMLDGDIQASVESLNKAINTSRHPSFLAMAKTLLTVQYVYHGQFKEAEDTSREIIAYSDKLGGEVIGMPAKLYLGVALIAQGRMQQGMKIVKKAQKQYVESGREGLYMLSEYILGKVYMQFVEKAAPIRLPTIVRNIGFIVKNVPFADKKSEDHFNKAIQVAVDIGAKGFLGTAYLDLGLLHKAKGRTGKARKCLTDAIQVFEECGIEVYRRQAQDTLASLK